MHNKISINSFNDGQKLEKYDDALVTNLNQFFIKKKVEVDENGDTKIINNSLFGVGFSINIEANNLYIVFPKNYSVDQNSIMSEISLLTKVINKFLKKSTLSHGIEDFKSNFPFRSFFSIYNYYRKFGLYFSSYNRITPNTGKKIDWKYTLKNSMKIVQNGSLHHFPIYYKDEINYNSFLTYCMAYAIDYTISNFYFVVGNLEGTSLDYNKIDFLTDKNYILSKLHSIKGKVFNDIHINLIDNLIKFYSEYKSSGQIYFYTDKFDLIWQTMVEQYLNNRFIKTNSKTGNIEFSNNKIKRPIIFKKKIAYPNKANKKNYIDIDHYYTESSNQYIFDAKYKESVNRIDYKQISYFVILSNYRNEDEVIKWEKDGKDITKKVPKMYKNTYSALIYPENKNIQSTHFEIINHFNLEMERLKILSVGLDIKDVMRNYIEDHQ